MQYIQTVYVYICICVYVYIQYMYVHAHPLSNKHIVYIYKRACLIYTYMFGKHISHAYIYVHIYIYVYMLRY